MSYYTDEDLNKINRKDQVDLYLWYAMIAVVSLVSLVLLPLLGSDIPLEVAFPKTFGSWFVYCFTKILVAIVNILIFHCFFQQGDVNMKHYYKRRLGDEILGLLSRYQYIPMSPEQWAKKEYKNKSITVAVTSILSAFCLGHAVLSFDWIIFLTYFITILMGLVFGVLQMKKTENYYSGQYFDYAIMQMENYNKDRETGILSIIIKPEVKQLLRDNEVIYDYYIEYPKENV